MSETAMYLLEMAIVAAFSVGLTYLLLAFRLADVESERYALWQAVWALQKKVRALGGDEE